MDRMPLMGSVVDETIAVFLGLLFVCIMAGLCLIVYRYLRRDGRDVAFIFVTSLLPLPPWRRPPTPRPVVPDTLLDDMDTTFNRHRFRVGENATARICERESAMKMS